MFSSGINFSMKPKAKSQASLITKWVLPSVLDVGFRGGDRGCQQEEMPSLCSAVISMLVSCSPWTLGQAHLRQTVCWPPNLSLWGTESVCVWGRGLPDRRDEPRSPE